MPRYINLHFTYLLINIEWYHSVYLCLSLCKVIKGFHNNLGTASDQCHTQQVLKKSSRGCTNCLPWWQSAHWQNITVLANHTWYCINGLPSSTKPAHVRSTTEHNVNGLLSQWIYSGEHSYACQRTIDRDDVWLTYSINTIDTPVLTRTTTHLFFIHKLLDILQHNTDM